MDPAAIWNAPPPRELRTTRLVLRALEVDHADALASLIAAERDHLAPWIGLPDSPAELAQAVAAMAAAFATGARLRYLVHLPDGALIGCAGLDVRAARSGELSYWLAAAHTGHGYAGEAAAALCQLACERSRLARLEIRCHRANAPSANVARQLGFVRTAEDGERQVWRAERGELIAWHHARAIAAALATVTIDGDDGTLRLHTGDGARVELAIASAGGEPYVIAATTIGDQDAFTPRASLAHSATLAVGALVLEGEQLRLRYACPPRGLTSGCLALLLHEAARLRALVPVRTVHPDAFACAM